MLAQPKGRQERYPLNLTLKGPSGCSPATHLGNRHKYRGSRWLRGAEESGQPPRPAARRTWAAPQAVGDLSHQVVGGRIPHAVFRTLSANTSTLSATPRHSPPTHPHQRRPPLTSAPGPSFSYVPPLPKPCLKLSFRDGSPDSALPGSG